MGLVQMQKKFASAGIPAVRSILMTVRPLSPTLSSCDFDRLQFTGRSILIRGAKCNELAERGTPGRIGGRPSRVLWVDPRTTMSLRETPTLVDPAK